MNELRSDLSGSPLQCYSMDGSRDCAAVDDGDQLGPRYLAGVLRRRWPGIVVVTALGAVLLTAIALYLPARYTAMAQLEIASPQGFSAERGGFADPRIGQMLVDTHLVRLRTRELLHSVFDEHVRRRGPSVAASVADLNLAFEDFEQRVGVSQMLSSGIIAIRYTSTDAVEAAAVANGIVDRYRATLQDGQNTTLREQVEHLDERVVVLAREMEARQQRLQSMLASDASDVSHELRNLKGMARADAQLMNDLVGRRAEVRKRLEQVSPDLTVVSRASVPSRRSSPHPALFIAPGLLLILVGSCFLAISREQLDQGLRSASDVTSVVDAPCIALVPQVGALTAPERLVARRPFAAYAESMRRIAMALDLGRETKRAEIIMVTASDAADGKTDLAIALSEYLGRAGRRVLLIDLDVRAPAVARLLDLDDSAGVTQVALERLPASSAIQKSEAFRFDVLAMEPAPADPINLAASRGLPAMLQQLRNSYDILVIDGPTALDRAEAATFAALADTVLLTLRWGGTRRLVARNASRHLRGSDQPGITGARRLAAVLIQVPLRRHALYRFGDGIELQARSGRKWITSGVRMSVLHRSALRLGQAAWRSMAGWRARYRGVATPGTPGSGDEAASRPMDAP